MIAKQNVSQVPIMYLHTSQLEWEARSACSSASQFQYSLHPVINNAVMLEGKKKEWTSCQIWGGVPEPTTLPQPPLSMPLLGKEGANLFSLNSLPICILTSAMNKEREPPLRLCLPKQRAAVLPGICLQCFKCLKSAREEGGKGVSRPSVQITRVRGAKGGVETLAEALVRLQGASLVLEVWGKLPVTSLPVQVDCLVPEIAPTEQCASGLKLCSVVAKFCSIIVQCQRKQLLQGGSPHFLKVTELNCCCYETHVHRVPSINGCTFQCSNQKAPHCSMSCTIQLRAIQGCTILCSHADLKQGQPLESCLSNMPSSRAFRAARLMVAKLKLALDGARHRPGFAQMLCSLGGRSASSSAARVNTAEASRAGAGPSCSRSAASAAGGSGSSASGAVATAVADATAAAAAAGADPAWCLGRAKQVEDQEEGLDASTAYDIVRQRNAAAAQGGLGQSSYGQTGSSSQGPVFICCLCKTEGPQHPSRNISHLLRKSPPLQQLAQGSTEMCWPCVSLLTELMTKQGTSWHRKEDVEGVWDCVHSIRIGLRRTRRTTAKRARHS
eukprot:1161101-Pelagomonas_calceolata.AAC.2